MMIIFTFSLGYMIGTIIQYWIGYADWEVLLKKYREETESL